MTYIGEERISLGAKGRKLCRLTRKLTSSKAVLRVLSTGCFKSIASYKK